MSTISGVSSSTSSAAVRQNDQRDQQRRADFEKALVAGGADPSQVQTIQSQIQQAIADAVKNGGSQRPDTSTIKNAVDGVLKANGVDTAKFQASIDASHKAGGAKHKGGHHRHGGSAPAIEPAPIQDDPSKGNQIDTAA
ncbi:MAG: hypothetical protein U0573_07050 [Phycisphaerales bacterium]